MKKIILCFVFMLLSCVTFSHPAVKAKAYAIADSETGMIIYSEKESMPLPMASTTKIMTALVYIENYGTDHTVIYTKEAKNTKFPNLLFPIGTELSARDALMCLLIASSNDMATALASSHGNINRFISLMNRKAQELNMKNTHYANVHGLDAEGHYSSCEDMIILIREAWKNPVFRSLIKPRATVKLDINGTEKKKVIHSTFENFYSFRGIKGVKTGTTNKAGKCFAGYYKKGDFSLTTAVLGSKDAIGATKKLIEYTLKNCEAKTFADPKKQYTVEYENTPIPAKVNKTLKITAKKEDNYETDFMPCVTFPIRVGDCVGYIRVTHNSSAIARTELYSQKFILESKRDYFISSAIIIAVFMICFYDFINRKE